MLPERTPTPDFAPFALDQDLAPLPKIKAAGYTDIQFPGFLENPLELREDLTSGCGGQTWPAGMVLAKHMLRYHRDDLRHARMLELGAGGGLVGLAVASGCLVDNPIAITDQEGMLTLMEHNICHNKLGGRVEASVLNWGEPLPQCVVDQRPNVILAADCVYFEPAFPLLLATLSDLLALCPEATIYFCFKKRRRADMQFLKTARKRFQIAELEDEDRAIFSRESLFLYAITSKSK